MKTQNEFLNEFFGDLPREGGCPWRFFIPDKTEFFDFFEGSIIYNLDCFISVNPFRERNDLIGVEKIYFDFDSRPDIDPAYKEFNAFSKKINKDLGVKSLKIFSGNKGYHIYLYLPEMLKIEKPKARIFCRIMLDKLMAFFTDEKGRIKLQHFDVMCTKNPVNLARVPFSIHPKSQRRCTIIHTTNPLKSLSEAREHCIPQDIIDETLSEVDIYLAEKKWSYDEKFVQSWRRPRYGVRSCILHNLANHNVQGGKDYVNRIAFVLDAHFAGWSKEEMMEKISQRPDFNPEYSSKTIDDILSRGYEKRMKCDNLIKVGLCDESCPRASRRKSEA